MVVSIAPDDGLRLGRRIARLGSVLPVEPITNPGVSDVRDLGEGEQVVPAEVVGELPTIPFLEKTAEGDVVEGAVGRRVRLNGSFDSADPAFMGWSGLGFDDQVIHKLWSHYRAIIRTFVAGQTW